MSETAKNMLISLIHQCESVWISEPGSMATREEDDKPLERDRPQESQNGAETVSTVSDLGPALQL